MKIFFKLFFLLILLAFLGAIFYLGYLGFIPGLSQALGATKPRDLGVSYSPQDYDSYLSKGGLVEELKNDKGPAESIVYLGQKPFTGSFSQTEISARLNYSKWRYMPVTNTQVRINTDGSIEFSGNLILDRLDGAIARIGGGQFSRADVDQGLKILGVLKTNPPVYLKLKGEVINNRTSVKIEKAEVGKLGIPLEQIEADRILAQTVNQIITRTNGSLDVKSVTFENGKMNFDGTVPEKSLVEFAK